MGEDPSAIREQIEQTRAEMGDTVEALGYKADVPTRARESVQEKVDAVRSKVSGVGDRISGAAGQVSDAAPDADQVRQGARRAGGVAQDNPLGLAVGSLAAGFLLGLAIPETRVEHERLGPMADEVKGQVRETAQEALDHGKEVAQEAVGVAREHAQQVGQEVTETAREHAGQAADDARERAQDTAGQAREQAPV